LLLLHFVSKSVETLSFFQICASSNRARSFFSAAAYRRFGVTIDIPLLFFMHFTGTMDHWDSAVTDGFAQDREVILFDNAGVSSSGGEVPASIEQMTRSALRSSTLSDFRSVASSRSSSP